MGCSDSKIVVPVGNAPTDVVSTSELLIAKRLCNLSDSDVDRLYVEFLSLDLDNSRKISVSEFLFALFDSDNSQELSFAEFIVSLWSFVTVSEDHLSRFAFELYDTEEKTKGRISMLEIETIIADMYGLNWRKNKTANLLVKEIKKSFKLSRLDEACNGSQPTAEGFSPETFHIFLHQHESLLIYPILEIYNQLRERIIGVKFWNVLQSRRYEVSHGEYLPFTKSVELLKGPVTVDMNNNKMMTDNNDKNNNVTTSVELYDDEEEEKEKPVNDHAWG